MKTKNVFVEIIEGGESKRYYVVREIPAPNAPAQTLCVCETGEELAQFFDNLSI